MCTKFARSPYVAASSCTESVMGPQNLLTQNTGVETTTIVGRPVATASATVSWCSSGSGTDPSSSARESTRSEEHTSELQSLMRISSAVFCLKKKKTERK